MQAATPVPKASVTVMRWTARSLAAIGIFMCGFYLLFIIGEGIPVGLVVWAAGIALSGIGAILAFRWEATAACFLIMGSVVEATLLPTRIAERTSAFVFENLVDLIVLWIFSPLVTGILLLVVSRKPNHRRRSAGG